MCRYNRCGQFQVYSKAVRAADTILPTHVYTSMISISQTSFEMLSRLCALTFLASGVAAADPACNTPWTWQVHS